MHALGGALVLLAAVLAACARDEVVTASERPALAPVAPNCEASATAALDVLAVDHRGAPVTGAAVTLSVEGVGNGAVSSTNGQGLARFTAVAACSSVGIWVTVGAKAAGFVQVVLPPGATHEQQVTVRPDRSKSAPKAGT